MDKKAFFKLSYGLYVISSHAGKKDSACIANTFNQVTSSPAQVSITLNKDNFTTELIEKSGVFNCAVLLESVSMDVIRHFGFQSGRNIDKFASYNSKKDINNVQYITEGVAAVFSCKVVKTVDVGTHILFIGEVEDAKVLSNDQVLTYENYHKIKKGTTPKTAPSYVETEQKGWRCKICGYIYEGEELPEDYICPVCRQPASAFEKI